MTESSTSSVIDALHASQTRLTAALSGMSAEHAGSRSYDDDWTIAQVASHLGSGADVFTLFLEAGLTGDPAPGVEAMQPIWDTWDAKEPLDQVRDAIAANDAFLARIDALDDDQRTAWTLDLFGAERDLAGFLTMRLSEHALHTWDIEVAFDPSVTVAEDAAAHVVDNLPPVAGWVGRKRDEPVSVAVRTFGPELGYRLEIGPEAVSIVEAEAEAEAEADGADAVLELPAEAWVRLVYGRLDPAHTPASVEARCVDLEVLRATFPGV